MTIPSWSLPGPIVVLLSLGDFGPFCAEAGLSWGFKVRPDYIDTGHHTYYRSIGPQSRHLMSPRGYVLRSGSGADIAIEGHGNSTAGDRQRDSSTASRRPH